MKRFVVILLVLTLLPNLVTALDIGDLLSVSVTQYIRVWNVNTPLTLQYTNEFPNSDAVYGKYAYVWVTRQDYDTYHLADPVGELYDGVGFGFSCSTQGSGDDGCLIDAMTGTGTTTKKDIANVLNKINTYRKEGDDSFINPSVEVSRYPQMQTGQTHEEYVLIAYDCYLEHECGWDDPWNCIGWHEARCTGNAYAVHLYDCGKCNSNEECLLSRVPQNKKQEFIQAIQDGSICRDQITGCGTTADCANVAWYQLTKQANANGLDTLNAYHCEKDDIQDDPALELFNSYQTTGRLGQCQNGAEEWEDCDIIHGDVGQQTFTTTEGGYLNGKAWGVNAAGLCVIGECGSPYDCALPAKPVSEWACIPQDVDERATSSVIGVCEYTPYIYQNECATAADCTCTGSQTPTCQNKNIGGQTVKSCGCINEPEPITSCRDGIQNGNEVGIDCGGSCEPCGGGGGGWIDDPATIIGISAVTLILVILGGFGFLGLILIILSKRK